MTSRNPLTFIRFFLLPLLFFSFQPANALTGQEAHLLLQAKAADLHDPEDVLNNWVPNTSPCNWTGVNCDPISRAVVSIDISSASIHGRFPSDFCRVPTLRWLSLANNFLSGTLSAVAVSPCARLRHLNLSSNTFVGGMPEFLPAFNDLQVLDLSMNNFSGGIPPSFGRFPSLRVLNLFGNFLTGMIPPFLGNLSELQQFNLAFNTLDDGPLPPEIGNLTKLVNLWLPYSNLVGAIPESIGKLIHLTNLDLSYNKLTGRIPDSIGRLESILQIELYGNNLSGELPGSLGNLTTLLHFDASENGLTGRLPENFAGLHLLSLALNDNFLEGNIPEILASNPNLYSLKLFNNSFSGEIPPEFGLYSDLEIFDVSTNALVGGLPKDLCNRGALQSLVVFNNKLSGELPASYGNCSTLSYIRIFNNEFHGQIPDGVWALPNVYHMEIRNNHFNGALPPGIAQAKNLTQLLVYNNNFSGELPSGICKLLRLIVLAAGSNQFSGEVPTCITQLTKLEKLELQENRFTGEIPVGSWSALTELNLSRNRFSGPIPDGLGDLPVLTYLDLSGNSLSGSIPQRLAKLKLNFFNLSNNDLSGQIPATFAFTSFLPSFLGNPGLCSNANLPSVRPCIPPTRRPLSRSNRAVLGIAVVLFAGGLVFMCGFLWFQMNKGDRVGKGRKPRPPCKLTSFHRVGFNEAEILDCMKEENLIGSGASGRVYRARLKTEQTVAVKRLWGGPREPEAERDFRAEVETLGRVRHGNIVKLLFCCAAEDLRLLVYEYMENGSLGDVLHGEKGGSLLDWERRLRIAVGAAQGLAYLHHDCVPPIVHRDVKTNNILLDGNFCAHVADFGLSRMLLRQQRRDLPGGGCGDEEAGARIMSYVAGSYGYIAPEYAYTLKVNEKSDVYSYGVVLLELLTGKRAVDPSFGDERDIVRWVTDGIAAAQQNNDGKADLRPLMDPRLAPSSEEYDSMVRVLNVGLLCTSAFPMNRPSMRKVVELLKDRRDLGFVVPPAQSKQ